MLERSVIESAEECGFDDQKCADAVIHHRALSASMCVQSVVG